MTSQSTRATQGNKDPPGRPAPAAGKHAQLALLLLVRKDSAAGATDDHPAGRHARRPRRRAAAAAAARCAPPVTCDFRIRPDHL